ncbi:MAG: tripartite tricarboxylate transporter TctB family protein [Spirochaetaceae bacterium]|nr:MAG: tripartite tricarboxylate transporter TctB family protein [Spirochaetaceae bacterium]
MTQRARNLTSSVVLMAVTLYWYRTADAYRPLSRFYPQVVAGIVFVLAAVLGILTLIGHGPVIVIAEGDATNRHVRAGTLMAALVLWTVLVPILGLLPASILGVTVMGLISFRGHEGTLRAILVAVVSVIVFYFLFERLLYVPFPMGVFQ